MALALQSPIKVTPEMQKKMGIVQSIFPLPRLNITQPGNVFRIFEKGGTRLLEPGNPDPFDPPGRPFRHPARECPDVRVGAAKPRNVIQ